MMKKLGIIFDTTANKSKIEKIFKDASNVSLFFIQDIMFDQAFQTPAQDGSLNGSTKAYIEAVSQLKKCGSEQILILTSHQKLTKNYEHATIAKDILKDQVIDILDTKSFGPALEYLASCIQKWLDNNFGYLKIFTLLNLQIDLTSTWMMTKDKKFGITKNPFKKMMRQFVNSYVIQMQTNIAVKHTIYHANKLTKTLYKHIKMYQKFSESVNVYIFSGDEPSGAKALQHELYTIDNTLNIHFYGTMPEVISNIFGHDSFGIFISNYEETII